VAYHKILWYSQNKNKVSKNTFYSTQDGTKLEGDVHKLYAKIETIFENVNDLTHCNKLIGQSLGLFLA